MKSKLSAKYQLAVKGLSECKASESNIRHIHVRDIVKKVEDHLKTYSSAGMDISWTSLEVDPRLPNVAYALPCVDSATKDGNLKCWPACYAHVDPTDEPDGQGNDQEAGANMGVGINRGVDGVPDFSTIIAQQLQSFQLNTISAQ
ncbi:hypothetical protein Tco_0673853 [Tanacetum coccineum]